MCLTACICSNFVAAAYFNQAADLSAAAIGAWAANDTVAGSSFKLQSNQRHQLADNAASVERFTEVWRHARMSALVTRVQVTMLLTVITAFMAVGAASARIIAGALRRLVLVRNSVMLMQKVQTKRVVLVASLRNGLIIRVDGTGGGGSAEHAAG